MRTGSLGYVGQVATELVLRDGTPGIIWPLLADDRRSLAILYEALDPQTKYRRFLSAVPRLTDPMLVHLVDEVDGVNHIALVLFCFDESWEEHPVGIARMVRYPDDPSTVDIAVTVREQFWGRGAASALLKALMDERPPGVDRIVTEVAADNLASLSMLARLGPTRILRANGPILDIEVQLPEVLKPAEPTEPEEPEAGAPVHDPDLVPDALAR